MKRLVLSLLLGALATAAIAQSSSETINLFLGEIKVLEVSPIERVAFGNSSIVSTSALKNGQLVLLAEREGVTSMHIWFKDGSERDWTVTVGKTYTKKDTGEVKELLEEVPGLKVREVGERIVLSGTVPPDYETILARVKDEFDGILDLTRKSPATLPGDKMVFMDVKITEFNSSHLQDLGIDWDTTVAGPTAGINAIGAGNDVFRVNPAEPELSFSGVIGPGTQRTLGFFGIASEITSRLNFLISSGDALILAQPRLSARSGGEAEFLSGGELPIPTTGALGQTNVEFKEFGISLHISPVVDSEDNIVARVSTEVSSIDSSVAVQGVPGFLTRRTETDIAMHAGETLVISGLVNNDISEDVSGIKFLSQLPILGALFRSTNFRNRRSELVIFVTPSVVDASSEANQARLQRRREMLREFEKTIDTEEIHLLD